VKLVRLRKLTSMQTMNDGTRSLIDSVMNPELIVALRDWEKSTGSGVLIGGLALSLHCKPRYTQDIDFLFLEPCDVPDAVGGFSRVESGFRHDRTGIAADTFTRASMNLPREIVERVIKTATLSEGIRVASPSGLVALKLFRLIMRDKADVVALVKTGQVDLAAWPLPPEKLALFQALVEIAKSDPD